MAQLLTVQERLLKFVSNLSTVEMEDFFNSLGEVRSIGDVDKIMCDNPITVLEVKDAIWKLKLNKSSGTDGLTSEFYKLF